MTGNNTCVIKPHRKNNIRVLILAAFVAILGTGCASCPPSTTIGTPARPVLIDLTQEQWERISPDIQDTIQHNDLALKQYARRLEARIAEHDKR